MGIQIDSHPAHIRAIAITTMPTRMSQAELTELRAKAVYYAGIGRRGKAWWYRLMVTQLSDALRGRLWPNEKDHQ